MRGYREQFEPEIAKKIEVLMERLECLSYPTGPCRYYGLELVMCLRAGALAGSMIIASALLEIYIRGLIVRYSEKAQTGWSHPVEVEKELEAMRELSFSKLLDTLVKVKLFLAEDSEKAKQIYRDYGIPLHHGLPTRLLNKSDDTLLFSIFGSLGLDNATTMTDFEAFVEETAVGLIDDILSILERNAVAQHET